MVISREYRTHSLAEQSVTHGEHSLRRLVRAALSTIGEIGEREQTIDPEPTHRLHFPLLRGMPDEERPCEWIPRVCDLVRERSTDEVRQRHTVTDVTPSGAQARRVVDVGERVPVAWSTDWSAPAMRDLGVGNLRENFSHSLFEFPMNSFVPIEAIGDLGSEVIRRTATTEGDASIYGPLRVGDHVAAISEGFPTRPAE
jgi:hypothetical protein